MYQKLRDCKPLHLFRQLKQTYNLGDLQWTYQFSDALSTRQVARIDHTLPIAKIISAKNARAWVSIVSYLKD